MRYNMKRYDLKQVLFLFFILFVLSCACASCNTSKRATEQVKQETGHMVNKTMAKDSSILEYSIDTTKTDDVDVVFEKIEYYPADTIRHEQGAVKSVTRAKIHRNRENKGETKTASTAVSVRCDTMAHDTATIQTKATTKQSRKAFPWWWLLVLFIIAGSIIYYKFKD